MTRNPPLLLSPTPTTSCAATVTINHVQLRDLVVCPRERGVLNYVQDHSIMEHNMQDPAAGSRQLVHLTFVPNTIAHLPIPETDDVLIAAGGQEAEIHLSLHPPHSSRSCSASGSTVPPARSSRARPSSTYPSLVRNSTHWQFEAVLPGSINNSILLTSLNLTKSHESSAEPRIAISNNDCSVKFYDVPVRVPVPPRTIKEAGSLRLDVPVNHSSISPDGRTLLSVGDSPKVFLHSITGGSSITFTPISTLAVRSLSNPSSESYHSSSSYSSSAASFSTCFSADGTKFAVAGQEGILIVWDVRSSRPLKVFESNKNRNGLDWDANGRGAASGWLSDDPWEWTRNSKRAPGWGFRSVKFSPAASGKEVMTFSEHTSLIHVVDGRTFEEEEIVRMPPAKSHTVSSASARPRSRSPYVRSFMQSPVYTRPRPVRVALNSRPPPPPRVLLALEDTFRIPASSASRRGTDSGDVMVIPSLGDRALEDDMHALLRRHRIGVGFAVEGNALGMGGLGEDSEIGDGRERTRVEDEAEEDAAMEVDELELDCTLSQNPSRAGSPTPPSGRSTMQLSQWARRRAAAAAAASVATVSASSSTVSPATSTVVEQPCASYVEDQELDLAGVCFDPSGRWLYAASVAGVAEWSIRGAEKRWWSHGDWA